MGKVAATLQNQKTGSTLGDTNWFRLRSSWEKMARIVNGGISFGNPTSGADNIGGTWVTVTTPAPGTDFTVTHNLGVAASGFIVMSKTAAGDITLSPTANTNPTSTIILRSTTPAGTTVVLFII